MNALAHKTYAFRADEDRAGAAPRGKTIHLRDAQHLRLQDAAGCTIRSFRGSVWITQDGDIRDIVLQSGEAVTLDRNGTALLSPLGEACIGLSDAGRISYGPHVSNP